MPLGLTLGSLGRAMRQKRPSSLDILSSKRAPRDYYKGKNCKPTGFHTRKGGYVVVDEKLPRFAVPDNDSFQGNWPLFFWSTLHTFTTSEFRQHHNLLRWLRTRLRSSPRHEPDAMCGRLQLKPFVSQCTRDLAASTTSSASLTSAQTTESRS
uniref:Mitochondrial ribosomal protein L27 n=1 Tax=Zea mays TaxID=4577 RepID=A0A804LS12_MAIZE